MCFYDLVVWKCGYWRWGKFRERCHKEYRTGETCGMRLVFERRNQQTTCNLCNQITKKNNTIERTAERMARLRKWNCYASVARCEEDLTELGPRNEIEEQWREHELFINAASFMHRQPL
ncbi:hypothetical protein DER44DRAFT_669690 [Fusarium oxysporum]|nr:hypothetical protein DER44DRAFT_669690 [Fusarium oxysporum]